LRWCHRWYHIAVQKTTVYLPDDLKAALARTARQRGIAEAEVIREAVAAAVARPRPQPGIFSSEPFADDADDLLSGFGER
jgi:Ribbon-helix-helix protein, copG family